MSSIGRKHVAAAMALAMLTVVAWTLVPAAAAMTWVVQPSGTTETLFDVDAFDAANVWAVGDNGVACRWDGSTWTAHATGTTDALEAVYVQSPTSVWAATAMGYVMHYDGISWEEQDPQPGVGERMYLYGICGDEWGGVWAVGIQSTVCHFDGTTWTCTQLTGGTSYALMAVDAWTPNYAWAVGEQGKGLFYDGTGWTAMDTGTSEHLYGIYALDMHNLWACGWDGTILHGDVTTWVSVPSGTTEVLSDIAMGNAGKGWAVGRSGGICTWHAGAWTCSPSGYTGLEGVDELNFDSAYACGRGGTILYGYQAPPGPTTRKWGTDSVGVTAGAKDWFLAEGCTGAGFETWILVANTQLTAAHVQLTYMTPTGEVAGPATEIPPWSRVTFEVAATVPGAWEVSTRVNSDIAVVAERSMYGDGRTWAHDSIGTSSPMNDWYLAEGSTGEGFETWVLVQNPNPVPATVELTFMVPSGEIPGPGDSLPAFSRRTYEVAEFVPGAYEVSTKVHSSGQPVVAERSMYGNGRAWGHESVGVPVTQPSWYLAEGCTAGGFETWVLVQNPNPIPADVNLTYMTPGGAVTGPSVTMPPNSRRTFKVADTLPDAWEVSTRVDSSQPIIAERAMYGNGRGWGHDSIGTAGTATDWYLAEGCTAAGFESWILVQNPNPTPVTVDLTYYTGTGATPGPHVILDPHSRASFNVAETVPDEWGVSTRVQATAGVVAERAMYGDPL